MTIMSSDIDELHWLIDIIQNIEVGLVVLDKSYNIQLWNGFMESYSGMTPNEIKGDNLFKRFPEIEESWFKIKADSVFKLKIRSFIHWKQKEFLFKFSHNKPLSNPSEFMKQNITLSPITSLTGDVTHLSMMVYQVED